MNLLLKNVLMLLIMTQMVLLTAFSPLNASIINTIDLNVLTVPEVCQETNTTVFEFPECLFQSSYANRSITLNLREGQTEKKAMNIARRVLIGYDFDIDASDPYQTRTTWVFRDSKTKRVRVLINNNSYDDDLQFSFKFQSEELSGGDWVLVDEIPSKYNELLNEIRLKLTGF